MFVSLLIPTLEFIIKSYNFVDIPKVLLFRRAFFSIFSEVDSVYFEKLFVVLSECISFVCRLKLVRRTQQYNLVKMIYIQQTVILVPLLVFLNKLVRGVGLEVP